MRPRPGSLAVSILLHVSMLALALSAPLPRQDRRMRVEDYKILPAPEKKIIWFKLDNRLPDLTISNRTGLELPKPRVKSTKMAIQASLLQAPPADQLVWQPSAKDLLKQPVDLPNMAAFRPPPPPEAPPEPPKPEPEPPRTVEDPSMNLPRKPPPRKFVPPPAAKPGRGSGTTVELADPGVELQVQNPAAIGEVTAVIAGIRPSLKDLPELPGGSRPGSVSVGPDAGRRNGSGGAPEASGAEGVELITRGSASSAPAARSVFAPQTVMFSRESIDQRRGAISVPVRVALLPPAAKEHFGDRTVYLVFLEKPNEIHYAGDVLMWFAAKEASQVGGRAMHAPVPFRQKDPFSARSKITTPLKGLIRLAAVVGADGFVSGIRILSGPDDIVNQEMAAALASWTFLPALRGGEKIPVDVMIDIPIAFRTGVPGN